MRISIAAAAVCLSIGLAAAAEVEAARRATNIAAQGLGPALQALARERDFQVIYISEEIEKLRTRGATGELTSTEALTKLLDGTGFTYRYLDEKTVTILPVGHVGPQPGISSSTTPAANTSLRHRRNELQLVRAGNSEDAGTEDEKKSGNRKAGKAASEAEARDEETEVRVTGSRIRRDPAETDVSPVTVFSRQDIERTGAITMADFLGRITQSNYSPSREMGQAGAADDLPFPGSNSTTVTLRGLGNNTTLVLLNGRRLPKFGQGFGQDNYDLSGIAMASVERIEILTNSASAIYGSDAIAGVVNIITRKDYKGLDLTAQYGNTFDSDVSEKSVNLLAGHAGKFGNNHNYSVTLSFGANDRNALSALDRPYTARSNYADTGGAPAPEPEPFSIYGGAGVVRIPFSEFDPDAPSLPGLSSSIAALPAGQDGRDLTIADFLASNDAPTNSAENRPLYRMLFSPTTERSATGMATLDLTGYAQWFLEGSYSYSRTDHEGSPPSASQIPVPAGNPFNPFGVQVFVNKIFYELGRSQTIFENTGTSLATGLRGALLEGRLDDWRYEVSGHYGRHLTQNSSPMPVAISFRRRFTVDDEGNDVIIDTPASLAINSTNPATAVNVFGDGRTTEPNDPDFLRTLLGTDEYEETSENWTGSVQADGIVMQLPGGPMKLAVGGEYFKESVNFQKINTIGREWVTLDQGASRDSLAAFAELSIPILGPRLNVRGARSLELSLAGRLDSESVFGEEVTPRIGFIWRPFAGLAVRSSHSRGYKTPNVYQLYSPDITYETYYFEPYPVDPVTGFALDGTFLQREGGNPGLDPERSRSWSFGLILEPSFLPQFSFSADYFDIDYQDRITGFIGIQDVLDFFPERVERDPNTQIVTYVDTRSVNLSSARARGFDVKLVHSLRTAERGTFDTQLSYTYNLENSQKNTPLTPRTEIVDTAYFPRVRANATGFWNHNGLELGSTVSYESSTSNRSFFGNYLPLRIRQAVVFDLQGSINFDEFTGATLSDWLQGTKITLGIDNVLDRIPSPTDGAGGYAKVDPRQRRFYLSLRKHF